MKRKLHLILVALATLLGQGLLAQNIKSNKLSWLADSSVDVQTATTTKYAAEFITNGIQTVQWVQKKGEKTATYTVTGTEGEWLNVLEDGTFKYFLERNGNTCTLILKKVGVEKTITLEFIKPGESPYVLSFHIQSVTKK